MEHSDFDPRDFIDSDEGRDIDWDLSELAGTDNSDSPNSEKEKGGAK